MWGGNLNAKGYGRRSGKYVHRVVYEALSDPLDPTKELHHICENPACCNPQHLMQLTRPEHQAETPNGITTLNSAKTHCPQGHEYTPENTIIEPYGSRRCRICRNARVRRRKHRATPGRAG